MAYTSDQVVVAVKGYSRGSSVPLDVTDHWDSYEEATNYALTNPTCWDGQLFTVKQGEKNVPYIAQPKNGESGFVLEPIASGAPAIEWGEL